MGIEPGFAGLWASPVFCQTLDVFVFPLIGRQHLFWNFSFHIFPSSPNSVFVFFKKFNPIVSSSTDI